MPSSLQHLHTRDGNNGRGDGWTDSHGGASPEAGGERDQRELTEREVSTQRQAASVVFFVVTSLFQMQSARCVLTLLSASRGHRHRFSSPPHPSIHPRHTIPSSTTAIQSRINTVTIKASERERERGRRPPCQTSTTMAEGAKKRPDLGRSRLLLPQTVPVAPALNRED